MPRQTFSVRAEARDEIQFFSLLSRWERALAERYPDARIEIDGDVHRAFVGRWKVGVFGGLPGLGYITNTTIARLIHRSKQKVNHRG